MLLDDEEVELELLDELATELVLLEELEAELVLLDELPALLAELLLMLDALLDALPPPEAPPPPHAANKIEARITTGRKKIFMTFGLLPNQIIFNT